MGKEPVTGGGDNDGRKEQTLENSFSIGGNAFAGSEQDAALNSCSGAGTLL